MKRKNVKNFRLAISVCSVLALFIIANSLVGDSDNFITGMVSNEKQNNCDYDAGGVEIIGVCYNCGVDDEVCPEDFGANCKVVDSDCENTKSNSFKYVLIAIIIIGLLYLFFKKRGKNGKRRKR